MVKRTQHIGTFLHNEMAISMGGISPMCGRSSIHRQKIFFLKPIAFLKNLFTMAIKWGKASENPVSQVRFFREDNGRTRFLTEEEEPHLLVCCNPYLRPLVITALHTGFRKSELLTLRWEHVDFRHHLITVEAAYAKNGETRSIPMTATLFETLRTLQGKAEPSAAVFRTHEGPHTGILPKSLARLVGEQG